MSISCDPNDLMYSARCARCIPSGMAGDVSTYLACQWANAAPVPPVPPECGTPTNVIQLSGSGMPGANQLYAENTPTQWIGLTDPTWTIDLVGGVWTVLNIAEPDQYETPEADFPCVWTLLPTGTGPAPDGIYAVTEIILEDEIGGFHEIIVDGLGNVGTNPHAGPATPDVVLADGFGGFWLLKADSAGNRYADTDAGPATSVTAIFDGGVDYFTLIVDTLGNIGSVQI